MGEDSLPQAEPSLKRKVEEVETSPANDGLANTSAVVKKQRVETNGDTQGGDTSETDTIPVKLETPAANTSEKSDTEILTCELSTGTKLEDSYLSSSGCFFRIRATRVGSVKVTKLAVSVLPSEGAAAGAKIKCTVFVLDGDWSESTMSSPNRWKPITVVEATTELVEIEFADGGLSVSPSKERTIYLHTTGLIRFTDLFKSPREYPSDRAVAMYPCGVSLSPIPFQNAFTKVPAVEHHERKNLWYLPVGSITYSGKKIDLDPPAIPSRVSIGALNGLLHGGLASGRASPSLAKEQMNSIAKIVEETEGERIWKLGDIQTKFQLVTKTAVSTHNLTEDLNQMCLLDPPTLIAVGDPNDEHHGWVAYRHRERGWKLYGQQTGLDSEALEELKKQCENHVVDSRQQSLEAARSYSDSGSLLPKQHTLTPADRRDFIVDIVKSTGDQKLWQKPEILAAYFEKVGEEMTDHMVLHDMKTLGEEGRLVMFGESKTAMRGWIHRDYSHAGEELLSTYQVEWQKQQKNPKGNNKRCPLPHELRREVIYQIIASTKGEKIWLKDEIFDAFPSEKYDLAINHNQLLSDLSSMCECSPPKLALIGEYKTPKRGWILKEYEADGNRIFAENPDVLAARVRQAGDQRRAGNKSRQLQPHELRRDTILDMILETSDAKLWRKSDILNEYMNLSGDTISDNQLLNDMKSLTECENPKIKHIGGTRNPNRGWIGAQFETVGAKLYKEANGKQMNSPADRKLSSQRQVQPHEIRREVLSMIVASTGTEKLWSKAELHQAYRDETNEEMSDAQMLNDLKHLCESDDPKLIMIGEGKNPYRGWISFEHQDVGLQLFESQAQTREKEKASGDSGRKNFRNGSGRGMLPHERRRSAIAQIITSTGSERLWRKSEVTKKYIETEGEIADSQVQNDLKWLSDNKHIVLVGEVRNHHRGWIGYEHKSAGMDLYRQVQAQHNESKKNKEKKGYAHDLRRQQIYDIIAETCGYKLWQKNEIALAYEAQRTLPHVVSDTQLLGDLRALTECDPPKLFMAGGSRSPMRGWIAVEYTREGEMLYDVAVDERSYQ